ncbi:MAG: AmmeMemoRadiSam system protein A [Ignavibacteria bacterium]|nr:AmmeMemoRadiSam system protein A [Ignavibacteria bacterium]
MHYSNDEIHLMKSIAKNAVEFCVAENEDYVPHNIPDKLKTAKACFVTIYKNGNLRGCIGNIIPRGMLYEAIINNAVSAATRDPRFPEVTPSELKSLKYEITVLSEPLEIKYKSEKDLFEKIKDKGVIIKKSFFTAVYLPQVWEHFSSPEEFLTSLCRKAGMNGKEWKKLDLTVSTFETER